MSRLRLRELPQCPQGLPSLECQWGLTLSEGQCVALDEQGMLTVTPKTAAPHLTRTHTRQTVSRKTQSQEHAEAMAGGEGVLGEGGLS